MAQQGSGGQNPGGPGPGSGVGSSSPGGGGSPGGGRQNTSSDAPTGRFVVRAHTREEEMQYDLVRERNNQHPSGVFASIAQMIKGALGAGILSSHVAYMEGGLITSVVINLALGLYMTYALYILVISAQTLYRRTRVPYMSYPDVGEAAFATHSNRTVRKFSKAVRYLMDICICLDLFGACTCYQLMVSFTLKQLVEDVQETGVAGLDGKPNLRIYLIIMALPFVAICLVRHLKYLAPFSIIGNISVLICIITTVYYSLITNPTFKGMQMTTSFSGTFTYMGMIVFSMSCSGVVLPIENNMKNPMKYPHALFTGMTCIVLGIIITAAFGYSAYREHSQAPITLNFPMDAFPKALKIIIALNIYATHGINFWAPFNLMFYYLKKLHPEHKHVRWEYIYRAITCLLITVLAIIFPDVPKVLSFLGCFCLSNMAFIWPVTINLLVIWERPGLGKMKWRLLRAMFLLTIGLVLFVAGSIISIADLVSLFTKPDKQSDPYYQIIYPGDPGFEQQFGSL